MITAGAFPPGSGEGAGHRYETENGWKHAER